MTQHAANAALAKVDLHSSLSDPLLEAMNFLNEVTLRYPEAISFGPGRPYEGFYEPLQIKAYLDAYTGYLRRELGRTEGQVRTELFQYGRTNGMIHELVARTLGNDENIHVAPESLVVTVGCQEAMFIVLRALFADPDDVLMVSSPCYIGIIGAARLLDVEIVPVAEGEAGLDLDELRRTVRSVRAAGRRPRAVYVIPDFSNPSGASMPVATRTRLLEVAAEEDLLLLEDNPYGFFLRSGERKPTLRSLDPNRRVIYFGSFAKTCFPGARVGYVIADQEVADPDGRRTFLADELSKIKSMVTVNTPGVSQAVIGGMLVTHRYQLREANKAAIAFYRENLDVLLRSLDRHLPRDYRNAAGICWNVPEGGFFLVLTLPFPADDDLLERSAQEHGVSWTPMSLFYLDDGGRRQIRLSCSCLSPQQIQEGVRRLASLIRRRLE